MSFDVPQSARFLRLFVVFGGIFSIGSVVVASIADGNLLNVLLAFTIQSNIFIWLWCLLALLWENSPRYKLLIGYVKASLTQYITITFLVFSVFMEARWNPEGIGWWTSLFNHYLLPWAFISDFFIAERTHLKWIWPIKSLSYPLLYLLIVYFYGQLTGYYPYSFFNPSEQGTGLIIGLIISLAVLFSLVGFFFTFINRTWLITSK